MTTEELRDWHARRVGWVCRRAYDDRDVAHGDQWMHQDVKGWMHELYEGEHPFPTTIDGAASAMPPGWDWTMCCVEGFGKGWFAQDENGRNTQSVPHTGDEIHDRYLLAKLAWEAMEPAK